MNVQAHAEEKAGARGAETLEDSDAGVRFSDREDPSGSQFSTPQKRQSLRCVMLCSVKHRLLEGQTARFIPYGRMGCIALPGLLQTPLLPPKVAVFHLSVHVAETSLFLIPFRTDLSDPRPQELIDFNNLTGLCLSP